MCSTRNLATLLALESVWVEMMTSADTLVTDSTCRHSLMWKTPVTEDAVLSAVFAERTPFEAVLQTVGAVERIGGMVSIAAQFPIMLTNRLCAISA